MRGIGGFGMIGAAGLGAALAMAIGFERREASFSPIAPMRKISSRGTGWRDRRFEHPQGETTFRATGSKRSKRRRAAKSAP